MYFISAKFSVLNVLYAVCFFYVCLSLILLVYNFFMGYVAWTKPDLIWFSVNANKQQVLGLQQYKITRITSESELATSTSARHKSALGSLLLAAMFASFNKFSRALHISSSYSPATDSRGRFSRIRGKIPSPRKCIVSGSKCATCNNKTENIYKLYTKMDKVMVRLCSCINCDYHSI